ncbi:hypothetical protein EDC56_3252 [Sinobacterium caligoides]|uniref:Uncharacterized protein n=1 Tax=Sinobacterium caligoides TaxID=933926 RepID=A0A3N2DGW9_9GAMM|nr:hypothetical protein [Sinobacterium caligoides]ROR99012.1 hypothetical protein EDC56_3252 [Sinobacterium caligoides]
MVYYLLIAIVFLIFLTSLIVFYAYKTLPKKYFFLIIFILIATSLMTLKITEKNVIVGSIPSALKVDEVLYNNEESWGFGPGGNEAGIRVFQLTPSVVSEIKAKGISFFQNMAVDRSQRRMTRSFTEWNVTPVKSTRYWKRSKETEILDIYDYVCAYGFCIDIDSEMVELANQMVNESGNFYSFGRIGLIIVSPSKKTVVYLYNG